MIDLDKHGKALLDEQGYLTTEQYCKRTGLSASAAKRRLRLWVGEGLIARHYRGCPNHYTLPDSPPMLGREARWRLAAQNLLEEHGFLEPAGYRAAVVEQFSLVDHRASQRDLAAWVQGRCHSPHQRRQAALFGRLLRPHPGAQRRAQAKYPQAEQE